MNIAVPKYTFFSKFSNLIDEFWTRQSLAGFLSNVRSNELKRAQKISLSSRNLWLLYLLGV